jgi:hypothetical protein
MAMVLSLTQTALAIASGSIVGFSLGLVVWSPLSG